MFAKRLTQSEESKKDTETQTFGTWQSNCTSIISSSLQSHRHLHKEHCDQCTVLTLCTATITIYARSIFLSVYSTSTISRLLLLFSRKSVNIPVSDNLSRSRSSQPLCPVNHGRTFLLFMLFCVITLVCTSKQSRATELFMNYTTWHTTTIDFIYSVCSCSWSFIGHQQQEGCSSNSHHLS